MVITFIATAAIGIVIGVLSGLLGVGGGSVMVPIYRLAFGMSPVASTATSLFPIIPTSISGVDSHVRNKTCIPKLGLALGLGGACLSPVGVWLAQLSPGWLVMLATALVIGYSAFTMLRKAMAAKPSANANQPATVKQEVAQDQMVVLPRAWVLKAMLIGAAAGLASGYVGLGGGFLMVPLMTALLKMPMRLSSGTSLIAVMILATPATVTQCVLGNVDYLAGVAMACGSIPGALIGARLISKVPERSLRFLFAAFLGVAAILLVVREFF